MNRNTHQLQDFKCIVLFSAIIFLIKEITFYIFLAQVVLTRGSLMF